MAEYNITSGVTSTGLTLNGDNMRISNGGLAIDTAINTGNMYISSGGKAEITTVNSGGYMIVSSGGRANSITVNSKAMLQVCGGGRADAVKVNSTGWMSISSGGSAKITENGGWVNIGSGAEATFVPNTFSGLVLESASATVHKNTTATGITLNSGGSMFVDNGGILNGAKVNSGGSMVVSSGATATEILENGGYVWVGNGANVKFKANKLSGMVLEKTSVTVHSGTTAEKFTLSNYGNLYVYTGTANSTTVNSNGYLYVSGGKADKVTLNSNGNMTIFAGTATNVTFESGGRLTVSGGKADKVTVKAGGRLNVSSGGTATGVEWTPCEGLVAVYAGGTVKFKNKLSGVYYGSDNKQLEHAAEMDGKTLDSGCEMIVMNGGTATNATVNGGGTIRIYSGGSATNATVNGGSMYVYIGGTADNTTLNGGDFYLFGCTATNTTTEKGAEIYVDTDGIAKNTTMNGGSMYVYTGGTAKRVAISGGALLRVYGGTALGVDWTPCEGRVYVSKGGTACFLHSNFKGVYFGDGSSLISHAEGTMPPVTLESGYEMYVFSGGRANNATVNAGGSVFVSASGTELNAAEVSGGYVTLASGGRANALLLSSGRAYVESGGSVNGGKVGSGGMMFVSSGGTATGVTLSSGGRMYVSLGGMANDVTVGSSGTMYVSSGGKATGVTLDSRGSLNVSGGAADNVTVGSDGSMGLSGGGTADNVTVGSSGKMTVYSGGVTNVTVSSGGSMSAYYGSVTGITLFSGGKVEIDRAPVDNVVLSGGAMEVSSCGATNVTVSSGGSMIVSLGGMANDVTVANGGSMYVSNGTAVDATALTGGVLDVDGGGILTGSMTFAGGATVTLNDGAGVVFDVSGLTAADCANPFLNDYSVLKRVGDQSWKIAVSAVQSFGTYMLAGWAEGFDNAVTVVNDAWEDTGVTLEVGGTRDIFGAAHSLQIIDSKLVLIVRESDNMEPADTGWNDTLYDKKTKTLNKAVYDMDAQAVTADTKEILIDTAGTVRALDDLHNFIGNSPSSGKLDAADFTKIELATAAKLSFNIYSGQAAKFNVWSLTEGKDKNGATTYTMKSLTSATLKGGYAGVSTSKKPLLLEAGTYYVSMELSNAKKAGEDGYYTVTIDDSPYATEFYTQADNSDDWDDMKTMGAGGKVAELGTLSADNFETGIVSDGWVGFSDAADYMEFKLESAAKLGFYLDATDATKFTVWQKNEKRDKNGNYTYSLKSLQSVTLKKQGDNFYWADTSGKPLILNAGTYYMSMESTNAKKGGSASYSISLSGGEFYNRVDNGDDWGDMKTDGDFGLVGDAGRLSEFGVGSVILEDWVGYGDAIDYKQFTLDKKTSFSFSVFTEDAAKFTVWRLDSKTDKKGVTTYSLKALGSMKLGAVDMEQTQTFTLDAGNYYFSMESTNAKKGGSASYTVELTSFVESDSFSAALAMPEADVLADVGSFDKFASLDGNAAWGSLLA